jgi:hypothetical protein
MVSTPYAPDGLFEKIEKEQHLVNLFLGQRNNPYYY